MTDEVKHLVEALQEHAKWARENTQEQPLTLSYDLTHAAGLIKSLSADNDTWKRRAETAVRDLHSIIKHVDVGCLLCAHYHKCSLKECPQYISGTGGTNYDGTWDANFKWSCDDFEYGTCPAMENTPCNGCDFENHWEWRGPCKENGGTNAPD